MLVLTRRSGQSVMINDDIIIKVLGIEDGKVRLGVTAPPEVAVYRQEVYENVRGQRELGGGGGG